MDNGWYLATKKTLQPQNPGNGVMAFAMIPVQTDYFIETNYLPTHFVFSNSADKTTTLSATPTAYPVHTISGTPVFWLAPRPADAIVYNNWVTNFFRLGALLFFLIALHFFYRGLFQKVWCLESYCNAGNRIAHIEVYYLLVSFIALLASVRFI
jgi:hypothetical protein